MAKALEIGPYDYRPEFIPLSEYVSERRPLYKMENEMREDGFLFSFEDHLREVTATFPEADVIEVVDSGCGEGCALWDFRRIAEEIGQPIRTTGITMAKRHINLLEGRLVDRPVIGTVQHYFVLGGFDNNPVHFILDYHGALGNSWETIIAIYANILRPRGTALLTLGTEIEPDFSKMGWGARWHFEQDVIPIRNGTRNTLQQLGLSISLAKGNYTLVEKE